MVIAFLKLSWSIKSDRIKAVQRLFITFVKYSKARRMLVRRLSGLKSINSRMIYRICLRPFLGGINFSILSEKKITPILSLFWIAENARVAAISVTISFFSCFTVPNSKLPETSTINITVNSRSSSNTFTKGLLKRAVTFQSMSRISSPNWYSRTSEKAIPLPLKAEWYWPAKILLDSPRVFISIRRTFFRISLVSIYLIENWKLVIEDC